MSWWQLDSTLKQQAQLDAYYRTIPPVACPNDGVQLIPGPPQQSALLYCPHDGWQYPRDYDVNVHAGM